MANIHQTMKRLTALYEASLGTREELTRCVEEGRSLLEQQRRLSQEAAETWGQAVREATEELTALAAESKKQREQIERLAKARRAEIEAAARGAGERWRAFLLVVGVGGGALAVWFSRFFEWILARF